MINRDYFYKKAGRDSRVLKFKELADNALQKAACSRTTTATTQQAEFQITYSQSAHRAQKCSQFCLIFFFKEVGILALLSKRPW